MNCSEKMQGQKSRANLVELENAGVSGDFTKSGKCGSRNHGRHGQV